MPQEWTVKAVWVVVVRNTRSYVKVFKRKHLAEEFIKDKPDLDIIREDISH